jgi:hypothetical protein
MAPMTDMRTKRSADRDVAIHLLLDAASRSRRGRGMALIDASGRMLAGAGPARETWAAVRAAQRGAMPEGFVYADVVGAGEPMRLATSGGANAPGLSRTAAGVARILTGLA